MLRLKENAFELFLLFLSMVDFKIICSFNTLLKVEIDNIMVLFLLPSKKLKDWLILKVYVM
jgi:hypothetical protein